jgi:hypothetical protein
MPGDGAISTRNLGIVFLSPFSRSDAPVLAADAPESRANFDAPVRLCVAVCCTRVRVLAEASRKYLRSEKHQALAS